MSTLQTFAYADDRCTLSARLWHALLSAESYADFEERAGYDAGDSVAGDYFKWALEL
tara:strand:+ start:3404 stop:3574 length:171 start_codon:yes stop_codon:yes gene_type:complete